MADHAKQILIQSAERESCSAMMISNFHKHLISACFKIAVRLLPPPPLLPAVCLSVSVYICMSRTY